MPTLPCPSTPPTMTSSAKPSSTEARPALPANIALNRRQQFAQLEHCAQQELALLRATREQQAHLQTRSSDSNEWLSSSVDWDLSVP